MAKKDENAEDLKQFDAKAMIAEQVAKKNKVKDENGEEIEVGGIIRYKDRLKVEIVAPTKHYKVGQVINPHKIMGEALINQGIAKAVKMMLIMFSLFLFAGSAKAQDFAGQLGTTVTHATVGADTVNFTITKARPSAIIKYAITKNSGTVAGTIVLQGKITSLSGEPWTTINSYSLTDATANTTVSLTPNQFVNYRVIYTTTDTNSTTRSYYLLYNRYSQL